MKTAGIVVVLIGLLLIIFSVFPNFDMINGLGLDKLEIVKENPKIANWLPYMGIGLLVVGSVILVLGVNRKDEKEIFEK